jgi:hypothetical protein
MTQSLIVGPKRTAGMSGDPRESERLRPLFLAWTGRRSNAAALKEAGIPHGHGMGWLSGGNLLRDEYQAVVRKLLGDAGGAP